MSKKKWIVIGIVVFLLLICIGKPIFSISVERVVLKTYSHSYAQGNTEVVLNLGERLKAIFLYNFGFASGEIYAEPCCDSYWLEIYFWGGAHMRIAEGIKDAMIVTPVLGDRYYVHSKALINFVHELIEQYDMVSD